MTNDTIVAVYDTAAHAEAAVVALKEAGIPASAIDLQAGTGTSSVPASTTFRAPVREEGFWSSLFGGEPDHDTTVYDRSLAGGSTVVSVKVPDSDVDTVMAVLESHHPIDIDERASGYGLTAPVSPAAATPMDGTTMHDTTMHDTKMGGIDDGRAMQLAEEKLEVGKRVVNRGGTRIRRFVVETPFEQNVTLREEKVALERRPVTDGRPVGDSFTEKTVEMMETSEEAVVSKTARVYEEVGLNKTATDRVETVRDTLRKEEVAVEQVAGTSPAESTGARKI